MKAGDDITELDKYKQEAIEIFESGMFPLHKWASDVETLESEGMPSPSKILGLKWDKRKDELSIEMPEYPKEVPVTTKSIASYLGQIYDPLSCVYTQEYFPWTDNFSLSCELPCATNGFKTKEIFLSKENFPVCKRAPRNCFANRRGSETDFQRRVLVMSREIGMRRCQSP